MRSEIPKSSLSLIFSQETSRNQRNHIKPISEFWYWTIKKNSHYCWVLDPRPGFVQHQGHRKVERDLGQWEHKQRKRQRRENQGKWKWERSKTQLSSVTQPNPRWKRIPWCNTQNPLTVTRLRLGWRGIFGTSLGVVKDEHWFGLVWFGSPFLCRCEL